MSTNEGTFTDFPKTSFKAWEDQIIKDLKGKSIDDLTSFNWENIKITPHLNKEEITEYPSLKTSENWLINRTIEVTTDTQANQLALEGLKNGANSLTFVGKLSNLDTLLNDILIDIITIHYRTENPLETVKALQLFCDKKGINFNQLQGSITFLTEKSPQDYLPLIEALKDAQLKALWIDTSKWLTQGANSSLQLALGLAQLNEMIGAYNEKMASSIVFEVSLGHDYFIETAKINALRHMISSVFDAYNVKGEVSIFGNVSTLFWSKEDVENNLLRGSISAMAGAIGGVNELTIPSFDQSNQSNSYRLSDNIQHMLKEESNLHWVNNATDGTYYINYLTNELITKTWELFQKIEGFGGYNKLNNNDLSQWLTASANNLCEMVNEGKLKIIGTTIYNENTKQLIYQDGVFSWN